MSANRRQTRSQDRRGNARPMPDPPLSDHENEESEPEQEPQPEQARRRTPQQRPRSETPQRRRARDRDPEDFNFVMISLIHSLIRAQVKDNGHNGLHFFVLKIRADSLSSWWSN